MILEFSGMGDKSKIRMNLAAIKKVDPYAKDIVDSSSHVAFYTFNSVQNEWEKTDVEGVFFIYNRNAQPYYSIFINNRLNTTSFVEPITNQLELQSQPPFLLYRNERSRIRGFWFYNSFECGRIGNLISTLVQETGPQINAPLEKSQQLKAENVNIYTMLSKAQQKYNSLTVANNIPQEQAPCNVLNFFASAKPTSSKVPLLQKLLPNTLSVEQLEKQQRVQTPSEVNHTNQNPFTPPLWLHSRTESNISNKTAFQAMPSSATFKVISTGVVKSQKSNIESNKSVTVNIVEKENLLRQLLVAEADSSESTTDCIHKEKCRPALMPPTMFDKPNSPLDTTVTKQKCIDHSQFVQAFSYLLQNDDEFVQKLHAAYLKVGNKTHMDLYQ